MNMKRYEQQIYDVHKKIHPDLTSALHDWHFVEKDISFCERICRSGFVKSVRRSVRMNVNSLIIRELSSIAHRNNDAGAIIRVRVRFY